MARSESGPSGRREASELPIATSLRFSPHGTVGTLLNISPTGLLAQCAVKMPVGSVVTVQFEGAMSALAVVSRVARCVVSSIGQDGGLRYDVGLAFNTPIALDEILAPESAAAAEAAEPAAVAAAASEVPVAVRRNRW